MLKIFTLLMLTLIVLPAYSQQQSMDWWVIGAGDTYSADTTYSLISTIGQPVIETVTNQPYSFSQGFWYKNILVVGVPEVNLFGVPGEQIVCYPNPFSTILTIRVSIICPSFVEVNAFNVPGSIKYTIASGLFEPGLQEIKWDTKLFGLNIPDGMYIVEIRQKNANNEGATVITTTAIKLR